MIDVCSGLETRRDPATGDVDHKFQCPEDLYREWVTNQQPNALKDDFKWTEGDPTMSSLKLQPLQPRTCSRVPCFLDACPAC